MVVEAKVFDARRKKGGGGGACRLCQPLQYFRCPCCCSHSYYVVILRNFIIRTSTNSYVFFLVCIT